LVYSPLDTPANHCRRKACICKQFTLKEDMTCLLSMSTWPGIASRVRSVGEIMSKKMAFEEQITSGSARIVSCSRVKFTFVVATFVICI
jgi:hypothetical protein